MPLSGCTIAVLNVGSTPVSCTEQVHSNTLHTEPGGGVPPHPLFDTSDIPKCPATPSISCISTMTNVHTTLATSTVMTITPNATSTSSTSSTNPHASCTC